MLQANISMDKAEENITPDVKKLFKKIYSELPRVVSLVLYLCSSGPDLKSAEQRPARPQPVKTKKGRRYFPPKKSSVHHTGYRVGRLILEAKKQHREERTGEGGSHASPVPHVRRAHWHLYWTGPRKQPELQKPVIKWIPPTPVGFVWEEGVDGPVIRKVKR